MRVVDDGVNGGVDGAGMEPLFLLATFSGRDLGGGGASSMGGGRDSARLPLAKLAEDSTTL